MLSVDKKNKKVFQLGNQKMFGTTPKTRTTVLRKHQRWFFLRQKTSALTKWFKCSTILNNNIITGQGWAKYRDLSFEQRVRFAMNILRKRNNLPFSCKSDHKKEKSMVSFTHEYYLQPNTVCLDCAWADRYLWVVTCKARGGPSTNEKKENLASNDNIASIIHNNKWM